MAKDFYDWYEDYIEAFAEEFGVDEFEARRIADSDVAKQAFDRGRPAAKSGREDARFCQTGEW